MRYRPCIDLHQGKVKQIIGSSLRDGNVASPITHFETELPPSAFAARYRADGLTGGHVIMLGPGNEEAALDAIRAFPGGLQVGGGIRPSNAKRFLDAGASHVIVTSYIFTAGRLDEDRLCEMSKTVGKQRLVLDLSCIPSGGTYFVAANRWQQLTSLALSGETLGFLAQWCDEFLVHGVQVEGKREGIDAILVAILAECAPIPVTYAGGVRSIDDLETINSVGRGRVDVTVGSALDIFGGTLRYADVVAWHRLQQASAGEDRCR